MPLFSIPVDSVYFQTGTLTHDHPIGEHLRPVRPFDMLPNFGVMVSWPRSMAWLRCEFAIQSPTTAGGVARDIPFESTREGLENLAKQHNVSLTQIAPGNFVGVNSFQAASLSRTSRVRVVLTVDTSHESFLALRPGWNSAQEQLVQSLTVLFFDAKTMGTLITQGNSIDLILRPAKSVQPFSGVVAIDLGNTSSVLAALDQHTAIHRTDSIRMLNADLPRGRLETNVEGTGSEVRLDRLISFEIPPSGMRRVPSLAGDDRPDALETVIGRAAISGSAGPIGGLILGAKRLLSGRDAEKFRKVQVEHEIQPSQQVTLEEVEIKNRLPAELLISKLLERFRQAALAWPGDLAITYPTTYTPHELNRVCQAVERAWLRMQGQAQSPPGMISLDPTDDRRMLADTLYQRLNYPPMDGDEPQASLISLKIDEASAAAFFFLYRIVFEAPGGLMRFRYLYPQGMNLLLYDCGGGTTDIALVSARSPVESPDLLKITVRGRSGIRGFGGDNITREVARLLKAKFQLEMGRLRGRAPRFNLPTKHVDPQVTLRLVQEFIQKANALDPGDELVPTKFDPNRLDANSLACRRQMNDLRRYAEDFKAHLSEKASHQLGKVSDKTNALIAAMVNPLPETQKAQALQVLANVTLHRWEIDALIHNDVEATVHKCNGLIRETLQAVEPPALEEEVHLVVASGNACRYPLIETMLREKLDVSFLEPHRPDETTAEVSVMGSGRFLLDPANLKGAVAKGAAMALMTMRSLRSVRIEFESNLSGCLPFDIGYRNLKTGTTTILYSEHDEYRNLRTERIPMVEATGYANGPPKGTPQTIRLERHFPGDDGFSSYLSFEFPRGIEGDLEVRYDPEMQTFRVRDLATGEDPEPMDQTDSTIQLPPLYRGDL